MAKTRISGGNGAAITAAGYNLDFAKWTARQFQVVDNDTSYNSTAWGSSHGSGVNHMTVNAGAFMNFAAASTDPYADFDGNGIACVLTAATGCTLTGSFVPEAHSIAHERERGAVPFTIENMHSTGAVVKAWAVS